MRRYDSIVIGTGGVGSAALYHLARRGDRVLGIERFAPGHDRGSSHGDTRLIRFAYFEHPDYVPLLRRADELWSALAARRPERIRMRTGLLQVGPEGGRVISGVLASARDHAIAIEELGAREIPKRFPGLKVPSGMSGVYEHGAGFLRVEECVLAHVAEATGRGATIAAGECAVSWRVENGIAIVRTDRGEFEAERLVITAGAWANDLLATLDIPLVVKRKPLFWCRTDNHDHHVDRGFPAFLYELDDAIFYGFPALDARGVKLAEHSGGEIVADPLAVDRSERAADRERVKQLATRCLKGLSNEITDHVVCLYTMTPDEHFVVDRHPAHPQVVFAAGLSGHGFKFASVLGEALADLSLDGRARVPLRFLGLDRPSLTGSAARKPSESAAS